MHVGVKGESTGEEVLWRAEEVLNPLVLELQASIVVDLF